MVNKQKLSEELTYYQEQKKTEHIGNKNNRNQ